MLLTLTVARPSTGLTVSACKWNGLPNVVFRSLFQNLVLIDAGGCASQVGNRKRPPSSRQLSIRHRHMWSILDNQSLPKIATPNFAISGQSCHCPDGTRDMQGSRTVPSTTCPMVLSTPKTSLLWRGSFNVLPTQEGTLRTSYVVVVSWYSVLYIHTIPISILRALRHLFMQSENHPLAKHHGTWHDRYELAG